MRRESHLGFTLLELLVVMTIIGILAALLLPMVSGVRASADQTHCLNNVHQIGAAIGSYLADHDNYYPGPIDSGQSIYYGGSTMASYLYPYIGPASEKPTSTTLAPLFMCPAWARVVPTPSPTQSVVCYIFNDELPPSSTDGQDTDPFGYPNSTLAPMRVTAVAQLSGLANPVRSEGIATPTFSMSATVMMTEADQISWAFDKGVSGWYGSLPKTPVHPSARNTLFWDLHAEGRPLSMIP